LLISGVDYMIILYNTHKKAFLVLYDLYLPT